MNKKSYYPNYFSIDDICVTQEKIPCVTEQTLTNLGFLDSSSEGPNLKQNQKVELPLWYILQIQKERGRNQFFKVDIPDIYKSTYGEICKADATAVELGKLNKYFYEFGRYVSQFDRNGFTGKMIYETCRERMKYLKDLCNNINNESRNDHKLDQIENDLYEAGCKTNRKVIHHRLVNINNIVNFEFNQQIHCAADMLFETCFSQLNFPTNPNCQFNQFSEWLLENTVNIKTSEMVINHRKRKRAAMEAENMLDRNN